MFPPFIPHPLVRGGHAQTVLGCYLPGLTWTASGKRHLVSLPDGDQLVLHDDEPEGDGRWQAGDRVALLVHGLGGSHQSTYMLRTAAKLVAKGVLGKHFRRSYRLWEEGVIPCTLFEIASEETWRVDLITSWVRPGTRNFVCRDRGLSGRVYHRCRLTS